MIRFTWVVIVLVLLITNVSSLTLQDSIQATIKSNPKILAEQKNQDAFKSYVDEERGDYFPTIDLESYYESSHKYNSPDNFSKTDSYKDGWNKQLKLEQILYDGGLTQSEVSEFRYKQDENKHRSNLVIEDVILSATNSYLDMVEYNELLKLSKTMITVQDKNLLTAKEQEEITGEKLEVFQVLSKLHFTSEKLLEQEDLEFHAKRDFKRFTGIKPDGRICRPIINEKLIPMSLEKIVELSVRRHYSIREQIEKIKVQRENLVQANSKFLPTILFQLEGEWDDDLRLEENGKYKTHRAKFFMKWNLYKGGKDSVTSEREVLFLQEAKKTLDAITDEIVNKVTKEYNSFYKNKKRVEFLKLYLNDNMNILEVYRKEFSAGTRTFVDILSAETEVYTSTSSLINREFELYKNYYNLLLDLSILSSSILSNENVVCKNKPVLDIFINTKEKKDINVELEDIFKSEETPEKDKENLISDSIIEISDETVAISKKESYIASMKEFLDTPSKYYTLNVSTEYGINEAQSVLERYNMKDKGYIFGYGKDLDKVKVLYGRYSTYKEAKIALKSLSKAVVIRHSPYIDSVHKHQKLYKKYN